MSCCCMGAADCCCDSVRTDCYNSTQLVVVLKRSSVAPLLAMQARSDLKLSVAHNLSTKANKIGLTHDRHDRLAAVK
jgi:hypothetical protein